MSSPSLAQRLRDVNWERLNYILIRSSSRRTRAAPIDEPTSPRGKRLWRFYRTFTREGRSLFMATLVVGVFSIDVTHTQVYVLFAVLGSAIIASLVVSPWLRLPAMTLRVHAPSRVFVGAEASFVIECTEQGASLDAKAARALLRVEGPFLPYFGRWLTRPAPFDLRDGVSTTLRARFSERGDLSLGRFRVSALVPLGLASGPPLESAPIRLRVVPRPANVVRLEIALATKHQPGGVALASKTGESMDLRGVRPYRKGDRVRDLSARTWARTGKPAVREYQEEYFTRVGVVLDCVSPRRPTAATEDAFEAAVSLTAGVVAHLGGSDALVDLLVTGGEIHALTLGRSLGFLEQALDHLAVAELETNVDRKKLLAMLTPHLSRLSAMVMIVDGWDAEREAFLRALENKGVRVRCIAVGNIAGPHVKSVSIESIRAGKGLVL